MKSNTALSASAWVLNRRRSSNSHSSVAKKLSAMALSKQSPTEPIEGRTPIGHGMVVAGVPLFIAGGSGGVGSFAIGLAKVAAVSRVITTAGSDSSVRYLSQTLGVSAESIARYDVVEDRELPGHIRAMNGERFFPAALDLVGGRTTTLCCELVDFDGAVTSIVQRPGNEDQELLSSKCAAFRFVGLRARAKHGNHSAWLEYGKDLRKLLDLVSRGEVPLPRIEDVGALAAESVRAAHRLLEGKHVQGKLVMSVP